MTRYPTHLLALVTVLFLGLPIRAQIIIDPPVKDWALSPGTATADQAFSLSVLSYRYTCAHSYANQSVVVNDGQINLSFTSVMDPKVVCPLIYKPYGPTFRMPALKAGKYAVHMNLLLPCHVGPTPCKAAIQVEEAGTLIVSEQGAITYVINPTQVAADQDFTLNLLSAQFFCNHEFTRLASRVQDGRITLTFLDKQNPLIRCIPENKMYGPAYKIGALKAGTYEVWAERLPACVEQGCKILPIPELVGKLTVNPIVVQRKGWFLKPKEVKAGAAFTLGVVNNDYGNCNTSFEHTSIVVQENRIAVSFAIVSHPERVCVWDMRPFGPSFQVQGLKAGKYPVYVQIMPKCLFEDPRCLIAIPPMPAIASDTLIVSQTLSLGGSPGMAGQGPSAAWQGGAFNLLLPAGAQGLWRADVLNLSGRRLFSAPVDAGGGAALRVGPAKPERGIYMIRLVSPARETHTLRVPVN